MRSLYICFIERMYKFSYNHPIRLAKVYGFSGYGMGIRLPWNAYEVVMTHSYDS